MNKEWSELNKTMQTQIKKKDTYEEGIGTLFDLRNRLTETLISFNDELCRKDFDAIPFINADEQVFFAGNYQERINSPIITTGNELIKQQIADFSGQLNLQELYSYIFEVKDSTEKIIKSLSHGELTQKISRERKEFLKSLNVVSSDENAIWLIDYWCNKDICGLIQMPFSRHWIMHIEACLRIKNKIHS